LYRIVGGDRGFEGNPLRKQLIFIFYFPESPLIAAIVTAVDTVIVNSWQLPS
jgi:hypothetical protein